MAEQGHEPCTVLVSSRIGFLTAEPYVEELLTRGVDVRIVVPEQLRALVTERFPAVHDRVDSLEAIAGRRRGLGRLHTLLTLLLASNRLNRSYPLLQDPRRRPQSRAGRLLHWLSRGVPKLHPRRFNHLCSGVFRALHRNPFPTRLVVAVSFANHPHLLAARGQRVATVVESWDHPVKKAAGYRTDLVIGWNADICADWSRFQGARSSANGYPVKLEYALEHGAGGPPPARPTGQTPRAMYPVGTSSNTDRPDWFRDELEVIEELCEATARAGWALLIKPKPNGRRGDFDAFVRRYDHVEVGIYRDAANALDYYLDDAYNETRLTELAGCDLVINCWTTFALDAAAAGKPVLQLDLRSMPSWPALRLGMHNYHLATYVVAGDEVLRPTGERPLRDEVADALASPEELSEAFRDRLRSWIRPADDRNVLARKVTDAILAMR